MSGKVMGMVLAADLPRVEKFVLVAIADHVTDDGQGCYASESRIVFKTGYDLSYVQKAVKRLLARGMLRVSHKHPEFGVDVWDINLDALKPAVPYETWLGTEWPQIMNRRSGRNQNGAGEPSGNGHDPQAHADVEYQASAIQDDDWDAALDDLEQPPSAPADDDDEWWNAVQEDSGHEQATTQNGAAAASYAPSGNGSHQRIHNAPHNSASAAAICAPVGNGSQKQDNHSPNKDAAAAVGCATVVNGSHKCGNDAHKRGNNAPINHTIETSHTNRQTYTGRSAKPLTPAMDARQNPAAKTRVLRERADSGTYPDNPDDIRARDQPETALQTKIAQLTNSRYLSASIKARLRSTVSVAWGDSKLPVTRPSPEDEWAANPELFAEYVELCARRISEESGQPPSRDKLVQTIRRYERYNTGWLDFRKAAQEERRQAQQRAHPSAKQNQWYYDPSKPDWMQ